MRLRWSSLSVLKKRATAPSAGEVGLGPAGAADTRGVPNRGTDAATAAVPTVFTKSRRERLRQSEPSGGWLSFMELNSFPLHTRGERDDGPDSGSGLPPTVKPRGDRVKRIGAIAVPIRMVVCLIVLGENGEMFSPRWRKSQQRRRDGERRIQCRRRDRRPGGAQTNASRAWAWSEDRGEYSPVLEADTWRRRGTARHRQQPSFVRSPARGRDPGGLLGDLRLADHRVGDRMAIAAEEADVEGLVIIPMMTFQAEATPAPDATPRARDQAELLGEGRRVSRRAGPDSSGTEGIEADIEMSSEAGELGVQAVPEAFFHDRLPVME